MRRASGALSREAEAVVKCFSWELGELMRWKQIEGWLLQVDEPAQTADEGNIPTAELANLPKWS